MDYPLPKVSSSVFLRIQEVDGGKVKKGGVPSYRHPLKLHRLRVNGQQLSCTALATAYLQLTGMVT